MSLGVVLLIFGLPLVGLCIAAFRAIERMQERGHAERMRALELGRPVPEGRVGASLVCLAIGGVVPVVALSVTMALVASRPPEDVAIPGFLMAMVVGLGGIIGGSTLAHRLLLSRGAPTPRPKAEKPHFDPDAYDLDPADLARR